MPRFESGLTLRQPCPSGLYTTSLQPAIIPPPFPSPPYRRVANRESARRVRLKRQELVDELQHKCTFLQLANARLSANVHALEQQQASILAHVSMLRSALDVSQKEAQELRRRLSQSGRPLSTCTAQGG
ncbi:hypothetical protein ACKKBG_A09150 [Auxenochlorella protothecoides x Auxenochlorella symbiontica]